MMRRCQTRRFRLLFTPTFEVSHPRSNLQQTRVGLIGRVHGKERSIVLRCNMLTCSSRLMVMKARISQRSCSFP